MLDVLMLFSSTSLQSKARTSKLTKASHGFSFNLKYTRTMSILRGLTGLVGQLFTSPFH